MDNTDGNKRIYGIDLGTTYSAIAFINDEGKPEIIPNSDNERLTPSVVFFDEPYEEGKVGPVAVGTIAKECAKTDPARVISFIKQEMGTGWTKEIDGITLTPEKVSSYILTRLAIDAKQTAGHDVSDVVLTCPAHFGPEAFHATFAAGRIAGLNVLHILREPIAAAMHYGLHKLPDHSAAIVYDLGGASFDVTVVVVEGGDVRAVCCDGNHCLGGRNWDERLVEYFASEFAETTGIDRDAILCDPDALYDLRLQAEVAKRTLSLRTSTKVKVSFEGHSERIEITRELFDEMTRDLLDQTADLTQKMFDLAAERGVSRIDNFVLVGGATRMPQVMEMVKDKFASKICNEPLAFDVDEAVAKGAALFGQRLATEAEESNAASELSLEKHIWVSFPGCIAPQAPHSFGIKVFHGKTPVVYNMIAKRSFLPAVFEREFPIGEENAEKLQFHVVANNLMEKIASIDDSVPVGDVDMLLTPGISRSTKIRIRLSLSDVGVLSLDATDVANGTSIHAEFEMNDCLIQADESGNAVQNSTEPHTTPFRDGDDFSLTCVNPGFMNNTDNKRIYGIDLGMTNSAIAFINDEGKPEIIPNSDNERITPSVVFFDEPYEEGKVGPVAVGTIAKECAKTDPARVISFIKQEMGTGWTKEIDGITLTPEKVSAYILKRLVADAKLTADHDVRDVIITCPAYFGDAERKATKAASEIAGLNVLQLLDEPVAAALYYGLNKSEGDRTAIVYDLGGATFDVTVVAIEGGNVRVVCSDGNHRLGGKNWDERVVEYFASKFAEATGTDKDAVMGDVDTLYDLQLQAEIARQILSRRASTKVKVAFEDNSERIEITRETFDEMTRDLLDQTADLTQKMFDLAAEKGIPRIDNFILVGGATRMPQVMEMVKEKFALKVCNEPLAFEVDEAVAKGAAIFGNLNLRSEGGGGSCPGIPEPVATTGVIVFTPRASRSYGVRLTTDASPTVENMIERDEKLPASYEREFPIPDGVVSKMAFQIYTDGKAGPTAPAAETEELGEVVAKLPRERSGDMKIRVRLSLSEEEILSVDVSYLTITPGSPAHVEFASPEGLCRKDIERLKKVCDLTIE